MPHFKLQIEKIAPTFCKLFFTLTYMLDADVESQNTLLTISLEYGYYTDMSGVVLPQTFIHYTDSSYPVLLSFSGAPCSS